MGGYGEIASEPASPDIARLTRYLLAAAGLWLVLLVAFGVFFGEIAEQLSLLTPLLRLLLLILGLPLAIGCAAAAWALRARRGRALILLCAVPAAYLLLAPLTRGALQLRFLAEKSGYDAQVADILADSSGPNEEWRRANSGNIRIDDGPPRRIAFVTWRGIPDPWGAIVYDPSGTLVDVESYRLRLFHSNVVGCRHLQGDYFRCSFS